MTNSSTNSLHPSCSLSYRKKITTESGLKLRLLNHQGHRHPPPFMFFSSTSHPANTLFHQLPPLPFIYFVGLDLVFIRVVYLMVADDGSTTTLDLVFGDTVYMKRLDLVFIRVVYLMVADDGSTTTLDLEIVIRRPPLSPLPRNPKIDIKPHSTNPNMRGLLRECFQLLRDCFQYSLIGGARRFSGGSRSKEYVYPITLGFFFTMDGHHRR
ncbi:unnamed protein product [Lactuca saligna]|uniref:Uncharacterized protein n=1 Tax=Lactuca saligna TaxID=75948 RepID=A0AA35ZU87_LACSI|nr:unnamed protein product [Lactuca saligna]